MNWCPGLGTVLANEEVTVGRPQRARQLPRLPAAAEAVDAADHCVRRSPARRPRPARLDRIGEAHAAQLDRSLDRRVGALSGRGPRRPRHRSVHHAARHAVRRHLHGARTGTSARRRDHRERMARRHDRQRLVEQCARLVEGHLRSRPIRRLWPYGATASSQSRRPTSSARAEGREKTGVFTGAFAINPTNGARIPIFVADYVLMGYGTGAIMAVPAHDERDFEFAREFELPIVPVIRPPDEWLVARNVSASDATDWHEAYVGDGVGQNSTNEEVSLDGLPVDDAKRVITEWLDQTGRGRPTVTYKLRDWLFSRQRYWGEPFPIVYDDVGPVALPEDMLPVVLPEVADFEPVTSDDPDALPEPPLARAVDWVRGRARPARAALGGVRRRPADLSARDQHDAAVGGLVLVLPAIPRPHQRRCARRPGSRAGVGARLARRRLAEDRPGRPVRRRRRARGVAPAVRALLAQGAVRSRLTCRPRTVPAAVQPGLHPRAPRSSTNEACTSRPSDVAERDGRFFLGDEPVDARVRQDGQEPEERRRARRHLSRLRRRHVASLRDVHGSARQGTPVDRPATSSACTASCSACGAISSTRRQESCESRTPRPTTRRADSSIARSRRSATTWLRWASTPRSRGSSSSTTISRAAVATPA